MANAAPMTPGRVSTAVPTRNGTATTTINSTNKTDQEKVNRLDAKIGHMVQHIEDKAERKILALMAELEKKAEKSGLLAQMDTKMFDLRTDVNVELEKIRKDCEQIGVGIRDGVQRDFVDPLSQKVHDLAQVHSSRAAAQSETFSSKIAQLEMDFKADRAEAEANEKDARARLDMLRQDIDHLSHECRQQTHSRELFSNQVDTLHQKLAGMDGEQREMGRATKVLETRCRGDLDAMNAHLERKFEALQAEIAECRRASTATSQLQSDVTALESACRHDLECMNSTVNTLARNVESDQKSASRELSDVKKHFEDTVADLERACRNDLNTFGANVQTSLSEIRRLKDAHLPEDLEELRKVVYDLAQTSRRQGEALEKMTTEQERQREKIMTTHRKSVDTIRMLENGSSHFPLEPLASSRLRLDESLENGLKSLRTSLGSPAAASRALPSPLSTPRMSMSTTPSPLRKRIDYFDLSSSGC
jgi:flagellar motor component MotA